jgi:hypothetical protein
MVPQSINFYKKLLAYILGDFFTNSSGQTVVEADFLRFCPTMGANNTGEYVFAELDQLKPSLVLSLVTGLPDISWYSVPKWGKIYQMATYVIHRMAINYPSSR